MSGTSARTGRGLVLLRMQDQQVHVPFIYAPYFLVSVTTCVLHATGE